MRTSSRTLATALLSLVGAFTPRVHAQPDLQALERLQHDLGIPSAIARIVDGHCPIGQLTPEIILIQDVHRHPEAQANISALLMYGSRHWGIRDVFLEGAEANQLVEPPIQDTPQALRNALHEGRIGGAEMAAALLMDAPLTLTGMEQPDLYKSHVRIYEEADLLRKAALRELSMSRLLQAGLDVAHAASAGDRFEFAEKLLQLRLKPSEYESYLQSPVPGRPYSILQQALHTAELFYVLADERSRVFTDVLTALPGDRPHAAVVGGFHTTWMAEALRKQGRSFVVLSPQITMGGFDELYAKGMQQTISALKVDSPL